MTHPGIPMLALVPGQAPGTGAGTGYDVPPPPFRRLDAAASAFDRARDGWLITRVTAVRPATAVDPGLQEVTFPASAIRLDAYDAWLSHVWTASACSRPVLLRGSVRYVDPATGEVTGTIRTDDLPDHVIYKPCGNRRATTCPGCAETYRRDAFHLIRAGLAGGKGVPESVAGHPLVFATFTAPSFGPVHSRPVRRHTCAGKQHCHCKAEPCHPRRDAGTVPARPPPGLLPAALLPAITRLGEPLCMDCYDYPAHVVWNAAAGELWRRTKQDIERHLIQLAARRGIPWPAEDLPPVRLPHGKAAEYQARGAVHFHALLRLDGTSRNDPAAIITPPPGITAADLQDAIRQAAATVCFRTRPHPDSPDGEGWLIAWGRELDVRTVADRGPDTVTGLAVASYLAKYATKGTEASGHVSARITPDSLDLLRRPRRNPHPASHRCLLVHRPRQTAGCAARSPTHPCAAGRTCSASAATSSPKPAATPSPSPPSARPASPTGDTRTPDPTTSHSAPQDDADHRNHDHPRHGCRTPEPAGTPSETPSSPTPPPTRPANAAKPDATNSPANTTTPAQVVRPHDQSFW